jgi:alginate O-acetyltransferase complex protein AlgI
MLFNSLEFLVFLVIVFFLFWVVLRDRHRLQSTLLLVSSCIFYMFFIPKYILILFLTILIDYFAGIKIAASEGKKRKVWLIVSIISTCLVLFVFKYYNFFIDNVNGISNILGWNYSIQAMQIILPIGLSFHTFQSLSYVIEVYWRKQNPEKDFIIYSLYVMYFPQLVAGPIERAANLLHQFHTKPKFNFALAAEGMHQILWGFFKKIVIADTCAVYANQAFANYHELSSGSLILGASAFAFQIYGDFSGYSDIALGTSKLFGVRLMRNFNLPYFATNIPDFWRRWHISLSTWFRDYVYIPLGGSRVGGFKFYRNVFIIFILSGIWHGANWTFVMWGLIHAIVYTIYYLIWGSGKKDLTPGAEKKWQLSNLFGGIITFVAVTIAWVFFRAADVHEAFAYLKSVFTHAFIGPDLSRFLPVTIVIIPFLILEWINRKSHNGVVLSSFKIKPIVRMAVELILALLIVDCYFTLDHEQFIYFQF